MLTLLLLLSCRNDVDQVDLGNWSVAIDTTSGTLDLTHPSGASLTGLRFVHGTGSVEDVEMNLGAWAFRDEALDMELPDGIAEPRDRQKQPPLLVEFVANGQRFGNLVIGPIDDDRLQLSYTPASSGPDRVGFQADCDPDDHFMGLGGHAMDVDHVGQAFPLWVAEPGVGKSLDEEEPESFPLEGTRHDASFPVPFVVRPHQPMGLLFDTYGRVLVDLCASDPARWEMVAWSSRADLILTGKSTPLQVVQEHTRTSGRLELPPPWVFGAWGDAIRGRERVEEVAAELRTLGAAVTVIWSEDWKGAVETPTGFRLKGEWFADETLYPDIDSLDDELEDLGFKWFGYFSPFLDVGDQTYEDALANDVVVKDEAGEPYTFYGVRFQQTTYVDVSTEAGRDWAAGYFTAALDLGIDGWMADYGEWLPEDAVLGDGRSGIDAHNAYPELWQAANRQAIDGRDATFFARSGWTRTPGIAPVTWAGDQRTDFQTDDGFPTVLFMGIGYSVSGVPVFTHDVAGYQSLTNEPSTKELWYRWAGLGAYSPVYRLHHGSSTDDNHQWDTDDETKAYYADTTREHMRLWPYRYGLARRAADEGIPMVLPISFVHGGEDWGRADAWMLGDALLVAPVLEAGATSRQVDLPTSTDWWSWTDLQPVSSGSFDAPMEVTPVFAAGGTTVPTFATIPDTLTSQAGDGVLSLDDVDGERIVYLFGGGGPFMEGDGTTYTPSGSPSGPGEVTETLTSGSVDVAGVTVEVSGPIERSYTFVVP